MTEASEEKKSDQAEKESPKRDFKKLIMFAGAGITAALLGVTAAIILSKGDPETDAHHDQAHAQSSAESSHADEHGRSPTSESSDHHGEGLEGNHEKTHAKAGSTASAEKVDCDWEKLDFGDLFKAKTILACARDVQASMDELKRAHQKNIQLMLEVENLQHVAEQNRFQCEETIAKSKTETMELRLTEETGSKVGRVLASINYRPPDHLSFNQLKSHASSYYQMEDYEKAAVIMTYLTGLYNNDNFKTGPNYLLTALSWYNLRHFNFAIDYADKVLKIPGNTEKDFKYHAQARLLKALTFQKKGEQHKSQEMLKELVDYHRKSPEARWINQVGYTGKEIEVNSRNPASDEPVVIENRKPAAAAHPAEKPAAHAEPGAHTDPGVHHQEPESHGHDSHH